MGYGNESGSAPHALGVKPMQLIAGVLYGFFGAFSCPGNRISLDLRIPEPPLLDKGRCGGEFDEVDHSPPTSSPSQMHSTGPRSGPVT